MNAWGVAMAAALALGAARADSLTFSGFVPGGKSWDGEVTASYAVDGSNVTVRAENVASGDNGYVNVSVSTQTIVPDDAEVIWTFTGAGTVTNVVRRTPYALAADTSNSIVPTDPVYVADGRLGIETAAVRERLRLTGSWVAPQARVTLGGEKTSPFAAPTDFAVSNADVRLSLSEAVARLHLLGTGTVSRIAIRGGSVAAAQTNVTVASDGLLEVRLGGIVAYSQNAAYGERPNRDAFCRICTMVAMDLQDAGGTNALDEVFGAFRRADGRAGLVYRPWIVPSARLSGRDGVMNSRLMLPVRAGDRFTLALAYAEYYPDGDGLRPEGGGRFLRIRDPLWVGKGSHAEAEFVFHAFGGEK